MVPKGIDADPNVAMPRLLKLVSGIDSVDIMKGNVSVLICVSGGTAAVVLGEVRLPSDLVVTMGLARCRPRYC